MAILTKKVAGFAKIMDWGGGWVSGLNQHSAKVPALRGPSVRIGHPPQ